MAYNKALIYGVIKNVFWLCYAISDFLTIVLLQNVYGAIAAREDKKVVYMWIIWLGISLLISEALLAITNIITEDSSYLMMKNLSRKLHKKTDEYDAVMFEDDRFLNTVQQAKCGVESSTFLLNVLSMVLFYHVPYLLMIGIYLVKTQIKLIFVPCLIVLPIILNQWIKVKEYEKIVEDSSALEREYLHYHKCIADIEYFKETRLLRAFSYFQNLFRDTICQYNYLKINVAKKMCLLGMVMQAISLIGYIVTIMIMIIQVCKGVVPVSVFFAIFTSFSSIFSMVENLVGYYFGQISEQSGNVRYLIDFLFTKEDKEKRKTFNEQVETIELKDVSFCYPNSKKPIIQNITCKFSNKETVAIVGENGSGKTTLVKILSGIYTPQKGTVMYNGNNIENYTKESIWEKVSAVFQPFQRYKMTLSDNVFPNGKRNLSVVRKNLELVRLPIDGEIFLNGYETVLSKEYGGIELSDGQWQRLAIARGLCKKNEILFLDEPTSAIDPEEETRLYKLFADITADRLAFIVTHRLGLCKIVDKIIVLDGGKMVEFGTHDELIKKRGKYFEMYQNQANMYELE